MRIFLTLIIAACLSASVPAQGRLDVLEDLIQLASDKNLAGDPYWETLMHYKKGWFSGYRSLVDDPAFFLSPDGKTDAHAELTATIEGLLQVQNPDEPDKHAICRFPARTAWLSGELPLLAENLPEVSCPHYEEISARIQPAKAALIFPFSSMADPASIFGHTMLRLEKENSSPLLGYAVTYGADASGAGPMKYIIYGIGGGFEGKHTVVPYSAKINEYTAIDIRDIWEYELNFTAEEVMRLYQHVWEMSLVYQDYYFFDENCAFNLLFFLEAARPGLSFTDEFVITLPVNTIRVLSDAGLVKNINFRPSHVKKMHTIAENLSGAQINTAKAIALGKTSPLLVQTMDIPDAGKAALLDLSSELIRYYNKRISSNELEAYQKRSVEVLTQRSRIRVISDYKVPVPTVSPEKGHESMRIFAGGGYGKDSGFVDLGLRFTYHSLEDNVKGYIDGMQVIALDINGRYYFDAERFALNKLVLADIMNLQPMTRLFKSSSWMLHSGVEERSLSAEHSELVWYAGGAYGATIRLNSFSYFWLTGAVELQTAPRLDSALTAGAGPRGGFVLHTGSFGSLVAEGKYLWYLGDSEHTEGEVSVKYSLYPAINHSLTAEAKYMTQYGRDATEYGLSYRFFF